MTKILTANEVREFHLQKMKVQCEQLKKRGVVPFLSVMLVGDFAPSVVYTRNKKKFIESIGGKCEIVNLPKDISAEAFVKEINKSVTDKSVHGCFIQLPVPDQLKHLPLNSLIPAEKDVDGFHFNNLGMLLEGDRGEKSFLPCTPKGIMILLKYYNIDVAKKHVVIIGRSLIVGKPLSLLLTNHDATVTLCHSKTTNITKFTKEADIIITAIGKPNFLTKEYIGNNKPVVIDVGINSTNSGKICGDVDYAEVSSLTSAITPVPGGIGPMTILALADNLLKATENSITK
ncbi:MAG: bifunctional 5,10-methylenetetrahydrofolate dehydrogenase/5,10-methenyltetrahydrofolate cyclohydrolase [Bacteriovoracaceae bacterium]